MDFIDPDPKSETHQADAPGDAEKLSLLLEINNAVVSHLRLDELLGAVSACLRRTLEHDFAGMTLYDEDLGQLRVQALDYEPTHLFGKHDLIPLKGTAAGKAFRTGQPVLVPRIDPARSPLLVVQQMVKVGFKSSCHVPLVSHDRALGTLDFMSFTENAFTSRDVELLVRIAGQIAIAVENSLNYERALKAEQELRLKLDHLDLLLRVNNAAVAKLSLRELVVTTAECLREVLNHEVTILALYDEQTGKARTYLCDVRGNAPMIEEGTLLPLEGTVGGLAFTTGAPVFIDSINGDLNHIDREFAEAGIRSGGCVPLVTHGKKLGVLGVASVRDNAFSAADKEMLGHIANQIAIAVENSLAYREIEQLKNKLNEERLYLEEEIHTALSFEQIIGASPSLRKILKQVDTVARTDSTVLIRGETGTGKELVARAIHQLSPRNERTLVKLNCAAIPTGLLESELFGHEKGAFTGAINQRVGRFELAHRGTIFLDEIGDIPLELQPKLLRVLQEQEFERLGSVRTQKVDVRVVAATNSDLEGMVSEKQFRSDLFYRLNVFPITLPPLRERREDIPLLVRFFAQKFAHRMRKKIETIPSESLAALTEYHWPGNIRELENFIERAVIVSPGSKLEISLSELKHAVPSEQQTISKMSDAEREHILKALNESQWVIAGPRGAAARLGLKRSTLQSRMLKLGISRPS